MCYNGQYNTNLIRIIDKSWSQFGLLTETRQYEVGLGSNHWQERSGEYSNSVNINRSSKAENKSLTENINILNILIIIILV